MFRKAMRRQKKKVALILLAAATAYACLLTPSLLLCTWRRPSSPYYHLARITRDAEKNISLPEEGKVGDREEEQRLSRRMYHYDASNKYKVVPFAVVGSNWSSAASSPLCLATQASVERMHSLAESLVSWTGPASVALFIPDSDAQIVNLFLRRLRKCSLEAFQRTSFHFVYPADRPPVDASEDHAEDGPCEITPKRYADELVSSFRPPEVAKWRNELPYPQNVLRNTAADRCPSEWLLVADVDMITPLTLAWRLQNFLALPESKNCKKCAFVLPTYELKEPIGSEAEWSERKETPETKNDLLQLKKTGLARPFHIAIFKNNQAASLLPKWEKMAMNERNGISVAYDVDDFRFWYEPVYVARHGAPQFDERFVGFGMTRNTQAYEMILAGYTFKVLENAFLIHWGFQQPKDRPYWRKMQSTKNYFIFKRWLLQKSVQYDKDPYNLIPKFFKDQNKRNLLVVPNNSTNKTVTAISNQNTRKRPCVNTT